MILFLFLPLEFLLGPDQDLKTYSAIFAILHFQTTKSHNFSIIRNPYYFFFSFSSVQGPTTQIGLIGLGHFEFKLQIHKNPPLLRSYYENENFFFWRVANSMSARKQAFQRPPRPSQHHCCTPIIDSVDDPRGPRSATCGGVGTAVSQTPRAISWHARVGDEPEGSLVWSLALATSAA